MAAQPLGQMVSSAARMAVRAAAATAMGVKEGIRLADCVPRELVDDIFAHALKKQTGVSLKYMLDFGSNPIERQLVLSSQFLHKELPVRLAHRVAELENLPYGLSSKSAILKVSPGPSRQPGRSGRHKLRVLRQQTASSCQPWDSTGQPFQSVRTVLSTAHVVRTPVLLLSNRSVLARCTGRGICHCAHRPRPAAAHAHWASFSAAMHHSAAAHLCSSAPPVLYLEPSAHLAGLQPTSVHQA